MKTMSERNKRAGSILGYCSKKIMYRMRSNLAPLPQVYSEASVRKAYLNLYGSETMLYTYCYERSMREISLR